MLTRIECFGGFYYVQGEVTLTQARDAQSPEERAALGEPQRVETTSSRKDYMLSEIMSSGSEYVTYGESDLGIPVKKADAIADIDGMDEEMIGDGTWYECDGKGNLAKS